VAAKEPTGTGFHIPVQPRASLDEIAHAIGAAVNSFRPHNGKGLKTRSPRLNGPFVHRRQVAGSAIPGGTVQQACFRA
jgi:hypothetical protein